MNISCISCPARYGVPDAKVAGKRVRITCKRCGAVLLVDGGFNPPRVSSGANAGPSVAPVPQSSLPPASKPPVQAPRVEYLLVMPDERQESADVAQIVRLYRDRAIDAETLVWCEGMDEWKRVWDVDDIAAAFRRMGYARPSHPPSSKPAQAQYRDDSAEAPTHVAPSSHPPAPGGFDDDEATSIVDSSRLALEAEQALSEQQAAWADSAGEEEDPTNVVPSPMERALGASAARISTTRLRSDREPSTHERAEADFSRRARAHTREPSRARKQTLDLFAAEAALTDDAVLAPAVEDDGARLTGARSENSVLFSLDQLVRQEQRAHRALVMPPRARTDESVLVDSSPSLPSGVVGAALAAPDFTAPVSAPPPRVSADASDVEYPARRSRAPFAVVATILLFGALAGAFLSGKLDPVLASLGLPQKEPPAAASSEPAASAEDSSESAPSEEPAAEASASAAPESSAAPEPSASAPAPGPVAASGGPRPSRKESAGAAPAEATSPAKEATAKPSGGGKFDTGAAKATLTAAANNASSCREATGPTGSGRVSITFAPSGRPTSVAVTGDLAGTTVGSCVARLFRATRVPPFDGDPVTVSKTFTVR